MTATKRLVLDLPAEWVEMIEARVARGEFASPEALVLDRLEDEFAIDEIDSATPEFEAWLKEGDEIIARLDAGIEPTRPLEDVVADIKADLRAGRLGAKADGARKRA